MKEYECIVSAEKNIPHFEKTIKVPQKLPLVYQYRNFQSFWQILKSDSFWATNARFSNDEAEQRFGMEVFAALSDNGNCFEGMNDVGLDENYIVCFCREDDKLSQWRGYAPDGGVSMGFDFGMPRAFSVLQCDTEDGLEEKNCVIQYVGLDAVRYIDPKKNQDEDNYRKYCHEQLALADPATVEDIPSVYNREIQKKAPYIKHSGFVEEDEYRLVFRNENGNLDKCIRYRENANKTLRYPYIVVKAVLPTNKTNYCVVRVCIQGESESTMVKELEKELKVTYPVLVQGCHLSYNEVPDTGEPFCTGCVLRRWQDAQDYQPCRYKYSTPDIMYEYFLHEEVNCIVISQGENQREIFEVVHKYVQKFNKKKNTKIAVWCEGHLPLRKITVGPCVNQESVVESIRHYCKHTYWLRDVEIGVSNIPFRTSL